MPNPISPPRPSEIEQKTRLEDRRADWERPTLRRLAAIEAQQQHGHGGGEGGEGGNHRHSRG
jgi:hypothetical protein